MSLTVASGTAFALVGSEGSGRESAVACLTGALRPSAGRILVHGLDAWRDRRAIRKRKDVLVLEGRIERPAGVTIFVSTSDPSLAAEADRIGFLRRGQLVLEDDRTKLLSRFRKITYVNEITETRTAYGNELDAFDAVRVRVRGWGVEAIVSNFDEETFDRFRAIDGVKDARAEPMAVAEIFAAVIGAAI